MSDSPRRSRCCNANLIDGYEIGHIEFLYCDNCGAMYSYKPIRKAEQIKRLNRGTGQQVTR